eukprot:g6183.t1
MGGAASINEQHVLSLLDSEKKLKALHTRDLKRILSVANIEHSRCIEKHELVSLIICSPHIIKPAIRHSFSSGKNHSRKSVSSHVCATCKRTISGGEVFIEALGKYFHKACFVCTTCHSRFPNDMYHHVKGENEPLCKLCYQKQVAPSCEKCKKLLIDGFYSLNGLKYCKTDYLDLAAPKCKACRKPIEGRIVTADGHTYHPNCFTCEECGCVLGINNLNYRSHKGKAYCEVDYLKLYAPRCTICSSPMTSWTEKKVMRTQNVCKTCMKKYVACFSCHSISKHFHDMKDGRVVCHTCHKTAIHTLNRVNTLLDEVRNSLSNLGLLAFTNEKSFLNISASLHHRSAMSSLSSTYGGGCAKHGHAPLGVTLSEIHRTISDKSTKETKHIKEIAILKGLPQLHCASTLAHELGHCFLILRGFQKMSKRVEEGLCELFAFLYLRFGPESGSEEADYRIRLMKENKNSCYGAGFRDALASFEREMKKTELPITALSRLLQHLFQYQRWP